MRSRPLGSIVSNVQLITVGKNYLINEYFMEIIKTTVIVEKMGFFPCAPDIPACDIY